MTESTAVRLLALKQLIDSSEYQVDADAVAEAIIRRLLAARRLASLVELPDESADVLEAG